MFKQSGMTKGNGLRCVVIIVFLGGILDCSFACRRKIKNEEKESKFNEAVVAADFSECSKIGRDKLLEGGNAADAAIAAMLCVGVYNCQSAGIGGGHIAVLYNRTTQEKLVVNAREKASQHATSSMFENMKPGTRNGTMFIATPGEVMGYWRLHQYGRLPWKTLFEPAIELARYGFEVKSSLAKALKLNKMYVLADPGLRSVFTKSNGTKLVQKGDTIRMTSLASTLQVIANDPDGIKSFYQDGSVRDSLAWKISQEINEKGTGHEINTVDLTKYGLGSSSVLSVDYTGFQMLTARPPSNGVIAAYMMNILDEFGSINNTTLKNKEARELFYHRLAETLKFACANIAELGDESHSPDIIGKEVTRLISKSTAKTVRNKIQDSTTSKDDSYYSNEGMGCCKMMHSKGGTSTSHVSVIDQYGSAVSMTSSINSYLGAKFLGPLTGIIYNNHMRDFLYKDAVKKDLPYSQNLIGAYKRPLSSLTPLILVNSATDDVILATGGAGAMTITPATVQVAMNYIWLGKSVRGSVQKRRMFYNSTFNPPYGAVVLEEGYDEDVRKSLEAKGHNVTERRNGAGDPKMGIVQLAAKEEELEDSYVYGYSDKRKKGAQAAGF